MKRVVHCFKQVSDVTESIWQQRFTFKISGLLYHWYMRDERERQIRCQHRKDKVEYMGISVFFLKLAVAS